MAAWCYALRSINGWTTDRSLESGRRLDWQSALCSRERMTLLRFLLAGLDLPTLPATSKQVPP